MEFIAPNCNLLQIYNKKKVINIIYLFEANLMYKTISNLRSSNRSFVNILF